MAFSRLVYRVIMLALVLGVRGACTQETPDVPDVSTTEPAPSSPRTRLIFSGLLQGYPCLPSLRNPNSPQHRTLTFQLILKIFRGSFLLRLHIAIRIVTVMFNFEFTLSGDPSDEEVTTYVQQVEKNLDPDVGISVPIPDGGSATVSNIRAEYKEPFVVTGKEILLGEGSPCTSYNLVDYCINSVCIAADGDSPSCDCMTGFTGPRCDMEAGALTPGKTALLVLGGILLVLVLTGGVLCGAKGFENWCQRRITNRNRISFQQYTNPIRCRGGRCFIPAPWLPAPLTSPWLQRPASNPNIHRNYRSAISPHSNVHTHQPPRLPPLPPPPRFVNGARLPTRYSARQRLENYRL